MTRVVSPGIQLALLEPPPQPPAFEELPGLRELCRNFSQATGWPLRFVRELKPSVELMWSAAVCPGVDPTPGYLRIDLGNASSLDDLRRRIPLEAAERLAESICRQLQREWELRTALFEREAELATAIPVVARPDDNPQLARRLQAILESAARSIGCRAAALYLLDDATTQLKLRSSCGLPVDCFTRPARPLANALADLEALLGHAVVLDSPILFARWNVPEPCQSALCVPVSSPTVPLGTLWFFHDAPREFSDEQTNLCEIVAGRLAAELERGALLNEQAQSQSERRVWESAIQGVIPAGPNVPPLVSGWEIAGWSEQAGQLGGAFHDWLVLPDGRMAVWVGDACDGGIAGAFGAAALRGMLRCELENAPVAADWTQLLRRCHRALAALSAGDHWAGLLLLIIDPHSGEIEALSSGRPLAIGLPNPLVQNPRKSNPFGNTAALRGLRNEQSPPWPDPTGGAPVRVPRDERDRALPDRDRAPGVSWPLASPETPQRILAPCESPQNWLPPTVPLGIGDQLDSARSKRLLQPGELLLGMNRGLADVTQRNGQPLEIGQMLRGWDRMPPLSANAMLEMLQSNLRTQGYHYEQHDLAAVAIKRLLT